MPHRQKRKWHLTLALALLVLGILISAQIQTQNRLELDLSAQTSSDLTIMVNNLSEKRQSLSLEVSRLERTLNSYLDDYSDNSELFSSVEIESERLSKIVGTTEVYGSGITVELSQDMYPLYKDVLDIVNELWAAGAEAVAINDYRLSERSYIYFEDTDEGTFITVDNNRLSFPIVISAIGNSSTLERSLTMPGGIINNLNLFHMYPVLTQQEEIVIPACEKESTFKYAQSVKSGN